MKRPEAIHADGPPPSSPPVLTTKGKARGTAGREYGIRSFMLAASKGFLGVIIHTQPFQNYCTMRSTAITCDRWFTGVGPVLEFFRPCVVRLLLPLPSLLHEY